MSDCPEIQEAMPIFSKRLTSFFWYRDEQHQSGIVSIRGWDNITTATWEYIWLPRIDQLQEIMSESLWEMIDKFADWLPIGNSVEYGVIGSVCWAKHKEYTSQFTSMEQLWLAFVMKKKYNKIWNGEEWVVQEVYVKISSGDIDNSSNRL